MTQFPHQSLKSSDNKKRINAITVLLAPKLLRALPPLPKPQPDSVFGYSEIAFNEDQPAALELAQERSKLDFDQPQFFSISFDHVVANINVHC